jgi:hypothetical protein
MAQNHKLAPERVRECLSRDVHAILSVCIHQFKDDELMEEACFDVDAVVAPASWSKANTPVGTDRPFTRAGKGNFIPFGYASA